MIKLLLTMADGTKREKIMYNFENRHGNALNRLLDKGKILDFEVIG